MQLTVSAPLYLWRLQASPRGKKGSRHSSACKLRNDSESKSVSLLINKSGFWFFTVQLRKVKTVWYHWIAPRKEMTGQLLHGWLFFNSQKRYILTDGV